MNKGQLLYCKKNGQLYIFLELYDQRNWLVCPVTKSGTYDEEEQHVEEHTSLVPVYSQEDVRLARLLFQK